MLSANKNILNFQDGTAGTTKITTQLAHGLSNGMYVDIFASSRVFNYNDVFEPLAGPGFITLTTSLNHTFVIGDSVEIISDNPSVTGYSGGYEIIDIPGVNEITVLGTFIISDVGTIIAPGYYTGTYLISDVTSTTFKISVPFVSTSETGYWQLREDRPTVIVPEMSVDVLLQRANQNIFDIGNKNSLTTNDKRDLVRALNEVHVWDRDPGTLTISPHSRLLGDSVSLYDGSMQAKNFHCDEYEEFDEIAEPLPSTHKLYCKTGGELFWGSEQLSGVSVATLTGVIVMFGGVAAPSGWFLCDGSVISQITYSDLYTVIGSIYNTGGEGAGNFRLPDLRQRFPLGKAAAGTGSTLGAVGGAIDHTHDLSAHTHTLSAHTHTLSAHTHAMGAHTHSVAAHFHTMDTGTGADLTISGGGSHSHTIDHDHGSFTTTGESGHNHAIDHDHASFSSTTEPAHTHAIDHDHASFSSASETGHNHSIEHNHATYTSEGGSDHYHFMVSVNDILPGGGGSVSSSLSGLARSLGATPNPTDYGYYLQPGNQPGIGGSPSLPTLQRTSVESSHTHVVNLPNLIGTSGASSGHTHSIDVPPFSGSSAPNSSHSHTIDVPALTGTSGASSGHTHAFDVPSFTGTSSTNATHSHSADNFRGRIGLVTGGVDGNSAMVSGAPSTNTSGSPSTNTSGTPSSDETGAPSSNTSSTNNPPYLVVNYIIKT
jgi:microcystin-dependent protein